MKIPQNIVLLCKDVKVYCPSRYGFDDGSDSIVFGCLGARGYWAPIEKAFHVDDLLHPLFGWRNVWCQEGGAWSSRFIHREDAICGDYLEEVAMNLHINGEKNVFLVQKKVVELLENAMIKKVGYNAATFFLLRFKWLKEKCIKIC